MGILTGAARVQTEVMGLILTTIGAVLTTLLGVLAGSALSNRSQTRQWSRDRQADACAQLLRESSNVMIELAGLDGQQMTAAHARHGVACGIWCSSLRAAIRAATAIERPHPTRAERATGRELCSLVRVDMSEVSENWSRRPRTAPRDVAISPPTGGSG